MFNSPPRHANTSLMSLEIVCWTVKECRIKPLSSLVEDVCNSAHVSCIAFSRNEEEVLDQALKDPILLQDTSLFQNVWVAVLEP